MAEIVINSKQSLEEYIRHLRNQFDEHKYLRIDVKTGKQRTMTQNRAMHLYCTQLSKLMNEAGLDFRVVIKEGVEVPWTRELTKEYMWRPVQKAITGKKSTTEPETHQYGLIYEALNRHISTKFGLFCPFPSSDDV